jgi:hypothetical protein
MSEEFFNAFVDQMVKNNDELADAIDALIKKPAETYPIPHEILATLVLVLHTDSTIITKLRASIEDFRRLYDRATTR